MRLRKRDDYRVASYALNHNLVLVTNDMYDLSSVYETERFAIHPGIVFITAGRPKLRTLAYKLEMFELALQEIEEKDPMCEAILVSARQAKGPSVNINIKRYAHP